MLTRDDRDQVSYTFLKLFRNMKVDLAVTLGSSRLVDPNEEEEEEEEERLVRN